MADDVTGPNDVILKTSLR